ncbi:transporter [Bradyrhizobium sp. U87765 SZCCT0131]|uniref:transporter n=1 Tax=unclassified Bradyrhizobium TaxID=2631580 RepID=UPI001BA9D258|nr:MULTISPECIES: transporter [unclassified Bradyrhizobium]MBR1220752.1 transporter [Bradyrhizobium sp. U87765 SZCCT0131]MBR1260428.1 transporter [Bradyrhizobium sp. U87765 SZCCT0134]MBR1307323.1 transporter [Bradyrhizobium sp. U87765 SZCCT0110]MBR1321277.1 transporter [Bradyrhizobium sp. U87765 SZCCT0109]MBR1349590.1 transporter [Bradyrhizobium sp. U87765 SZCCT0048]
MRILMILSPEVAAAEDADPAITLEWAAPPYYTFLDAGIEVVLASLEGGPMRMVESGNDASAADIARLKQDRSALDAFADTLRLDQAYMEDFDAAFCVGRPELAWQSGAASSAGSIVAELLAAGKPVAVTPSRADPHPKGISERLIVIGNSVQAPVEIARALIGTIRETQARKGIDP